MRGVRITLNGGRAAQAELQRIAGALGNRELNVGFLATARYPDGTPVAQVAFWDEFGTVRSPARPFMRDTIAKHSSKWGEAIRLNLIATNYDADRALARVGIGISDQVTQSIVQFTTPGNAPSTIERKGFDKPLIDTGVMQRSVSFEVTRVR